MLLARASLRIDWEGFNEGFARVSRTAAFERTEGTLPCSSKPRVARVFEQCPRGPFWVLSANTEPCPRRHHVFVWSIWGIRTFQQDRSKARTAADFGTRPVNLEGVHRDSSALPRAVFMFSPAGVVDLRFSPYKFLIPVYGDVNTCKRAVVQISNYLDR